MSPEGKSVGANVVSQDPKSNQAYKMLDDIIAKQPADAHREDIRELSGAFIEYLSVVGGTYFNDVSEMYPLLQGEDLCVRRENPRVVVQALAGEHTIELRAPESIEPYPNAVEWNYQYGARGLENAFLEGHGHLNGIVTVIGFTPQHVKKADIKNESSAIIQPGGNAIDRSHVVSIDGTIPKEDIRFIVTKIPQNLVPDKFLTDEERDRAEESTASGPKYIFRGVLFDTHKETPAHS